MGINIVDWLVLGLTIAFIVIYGIYKSKKAGSEVGDFLKGTAPIKWWTIGISVMATQASAITFMSTPGQAYHDGMGFVQMYLGLPIAMVIISITFIPMFHKLNVYTAYEYLENRFDNKTRALTSILFLIQRGLGTGLTIYAPSIILSTILRWDLHTLNIIIGSLVVLYIVSGGTRAVSITQNQQMAVMMGGMFIAFIMILTMLPDHIGLTEALQIADAGEKMKIIDFSFNLESRYTFWSGITGGMFLALAYFGTDQSQVQRYISGNDVRESRLGLMFNGLLKVPMQFFILLCGIMVFVFFKFHKAPIFFNQALLTKTEMAGYDKDIALFNSQYDAVFSERKMLLNHSQDFSNPDLKTKLLALDTEEKRIRKDVNVLINKANSESENSDKDYVFITFILTYFPKGIVGLLLAVIICASMSATASGISALATCTTVDIYKRNFAQNRDDEHFLKASKWMVILWGVIAIVAANLSSLFENLIQFVNIVGSIFYGTILGIFVVGFYFKRIQSNQVFYAACISQILIILVYLKGNLGYLWLNALGCFLVFIFSHLLSLVLKK